MNTCWKCKNPLRTDNLAFCPICGTALGRDAATARDWALRLEEGSQHLHWGLSLLWFLCGPGLLLVFPFLLARANRRLRRHQAERLKAPAFASPRFVESPEGQAILARFRSAGGNPDSPDAWRGFAQPLILCLLIAVTFGTMFIVPACAPMQVPYDRALAAVVGGGPQYCYKYFSGPEGYDAFWQGINDSAMYSDIQVTGYGNYGSKSSSAPLWTGGSDTHARHRPYEYTDENGYHCRVSSVSFHADYAPEAHVVFLIGLLSLYLCQLWFGLSFWLRLARHSQAEVLAAAYARGDLKYHDDMLGKVRLLNGLLIAVAILLAISPGQVVLFPLMSAVVFAHHLRWERRNGITSSLGLANP